MMTDVECCICGKYTRQVAGRWFGGEFGPMQIAVPICIRCELYIPKDSIDKILLSKYNSECNKQKGIDYVCE